MLRLRYALVCGAALTGAAGTASAADLPAPPVYPAPTAPAVYQPAPPPFSWTGFYIGGNAGYGWGNGTGTLALVGPATASFNTSSSGFVGGGQAGFNWQFGPAVIGAEADFQGTTGSGSVSSTALTGITEKEPYFGTVRGRLGYAFDRFMIYATGGGVYGSTTLNGTGFSSSATFWTWTAGAGFEWAMWGPVSAKLEYLYAGTPSNVPSLAPFALVKSGSSSENSRAPRPQLPLLRSHAFHPKKPAALAAGFFMRCVLPVAAPRLRRPTPVIWQLWPACAPVSILTAVLQRRAPRPAASC